MSAIPAKVPQEFCPICGNKTERYRPFDEVFSELNISPEMRRELVFHLAAMRARKTIEALLSPAKEES